MSWLVAAFLAFQVYVLSLVNAIVPDDYMDEIFHGPQAGEYCRGAFTSWHPKITTFPGIYILGALYGWARWAVHALVSPLPMETPCTIPFLRSLNVLLSGACLVVVRNILTTYRHGGGGVSSGRGSGSGHAPVSPELQALLLALYPLHWFFSFMYYTDVASLLFLLVTQLQVARRRYVLAALAGSVAVLCRQTNVVWVAFLLGEAALAEVGMDWAHVQAPRRFQGDGGDGGPRRLPGGLAKDRGLVQELLMAMSRLWRQRAQLAARLWPLLLPPAGFAAFLVVNRGSVVLGDKEAHRAVRHGAQLLYFGGWAALMLGPQLVPGAVRALYGAARRRPLTALLTAAAAVAAAAAVGHVSTLVHPYLLADNRHYVFYLWRRLLARSPSAKYLLAPAYAAAWALLLAGLLRRMTVSWVAGLMGCLVAQLLPAWLLELRYFTPGLVLIATRLEPPGRLQAGALLLIYGTINAVTMYMFLYRPYRFADGSTARFLW